MTAKKRKIIFRKTKDAKYRRLKMPELKYDYSELKGDIKKVYGTQSAFAKALGMAEPTLSLKLNNNADWSQDEMELALLLLNKGAEKVVPYFFTHEV